ncbi:choice-of-anchor L domain-containing protein [Seonamhaeicola sp. NFXS20]|uniref:choice-of-anchor L domain-containing protein n=1 Tax=Seonamhaeicola sp. NFXS20 TaxID=2816959 RepID=UPI003B8E1D15
MKYYIYIILLVFSFKNFAQNIQVDSQTYTPQQLIEDILINSNCIENVSVTNVIGGNFNGTDQSYGYFDATGTSFPFQNGIVLSTGRLSNVEGPNNNLSDDDALNWNGDNDLENILNESNTLNATIIEFEFTSTSNFVSFRYLFASEEYQENNDNTCKYSDLFGFLIRNVNDTQYTNIALIPNTQTPVKVTTVHPGIPNGCAAQNPTYFGSWNDQTAPINFNGQTAVLTATANTIPNETYHVKLVIADEQNYRYDSAVFLEAGSFELSTDLGPDRLISTNNPLCENETLTLDAFQSGNNTYKWFKDGNEILSETNATYLVENAGTYTVEVTLENNCIAYGEIIVEYSQSPVTLNTTLIQCDANQDGLTTYNLLDAQQNITNGSNSVNISFYTSYTNAQNTLNPIQNPESFQNTSPQQIIYVRVENSFGCFSIAELTLDISNESINIPPFIACDDNIIDGLTEFNVSDLINHIEQNINNNLTVQLYKTEQDALNSLNIITGTYTNTIEYNETLFVKTKTNNGSCYAIGTLELQVLEPPIFNESSNTIYCLNYFPNTITINSGLLNGTNNNPTFEWYFNNVLLSENTSSIEVNEIGTYTVNVSFSNGCSASSNILVNASNIATIDNIEIEQTSANNSVTVNVTGEGDYQYALDSQIFNDNKVFTNISSGFHTIFVLDKNGCGIIEEEIAVLGFPKFFTPNNDGYNDTWKPLGVNEIFNSNIQIQIFNRFGKLLKTINPIESGWDGSFAGKPLSSDDYWYVALLPNGTSFKGHFTLKR